MSHFIQKPTPGRIVLYRTDGRNGLVYDLPAVVTVTRASHPGDYPGGESNPLPVPSSDAHVHLTVLTPGGFGSEVVATKNTVSTERLDDPIDEDFVGAHSFVPGSGTYVEWDVPPCHPDDPKPRTWRYPPRTDRQVEVPDDPAG